MEKTSHRAQFDGEISAITARDVRPATSNWRAALPPLDGALVTLRDLKMSDASPLLSAVGADQVSRFISPPPSTLEGFERFIVWSHRQRDEGQCACFAVVLHGSDSPVGLFQIRSLAPGFTTAEWGFALSPELWGTGVFTDGARLAIDFAFTVLGAHRLEARAALRNARGNRALRKLGAIQQGVLGSAFLRDGQYFDQALWTILLEHWLEARAGWSGGVIH
jgi:RimJ/RimL family protein N-acetyltransferase